MPNIEDFRSYWLALAGGAYEERARLADYSLESRFWELAGFGRGGDFPEGPARMEGLGRIARELLERLTTPAPDAATGEMFLNHPLRWCLLAERTDCLDDELFLRFINKWPHSWRSDLLFVSGRMDMVRAQFDGIEPAAGSAGAIELECRLALADRFGRLAPTAMESPESASSRFLAFVDFNGKEHLLQACRQIERLKVTTLAHQSLGNDLHAILARMAASHFDPEDAPGLIEELRGFQETTLILVEEYSAAARRELRALLAERLGGPELLRLKEALLAGLMRPVEYSESPKAPASGEFDATRMRSMIAAVPAGLFGWFRESLTAGDLAESMAIVLDALVGGSRKKLEKSIKHYSQMALKSLALLPLPKAPGARSEEVLSRYLVIDKFAKSSGKFGVQRQANNRTCAEIALNNLALNAGYDDADELFFEVESRLALDSADAGFKAGGYRVGMEFGASGPVLVVEKDGKPLKSVPAALKKTAGFKEFKTTFDASREQSRRFRRALEKRMAVAAVIDRKQFATLWQAPLLRGLLATLVFVDDEGCSGMPDETGESMTEADGTRVSLDGRALRIAHPVVLDRLGVLPAWRTYCLAHEVVQAVRQVFREFYVITPAELASSPLSLRFSGHLMASRTLSGLLKSRGWNCVGVDGPEPRKPFGLAGITGYFALEDCGYHLTEKECVESSAISFRNGSGAALPLDSVPETIFSEVMRDADLFVSVAQTSETGTPSKELIAQRLDLLKGLIGKLRIKGVTVQGHHAVIEGQRCRYLVHLASGAVHLGDLRHVCIVPAASWKRPAKLFLPFVEEDDRRIAELFSKILLLANDSKITDPGILAQIRDVQGS